MFNVIAWQSNDSSNKNLLNMSQGKMICEVFISQKIKKLHNRNYIVYINPITGSMKRGK